VTGQPSPAAETPQETREERAERWRADHARRRAIVAGCANWQECALALRAAGELPAGMLAALGLGSPGGERRGSVPP
jgi:hypothetical protein